MTATSHQRWSLLLALVGAALLALVGAPPSAHADGRPAAAVAPDDDSAPSPIIYPPERRTVRFTHAEHGATLDLVCDDCHAGATTSTSAADLLLPRGAACDRCHGTDHSDPDGVVAVEGPRQTTCLTCHAPVAAGSDAVARQVYPRPNLRFDHAAHARRNIACAQCHGDLGRGAPEGRRSLPRMQRCAQCHFAAGSARGDAPARCSTCHLTRGGILRTEYPNGQLLPPRWLGNARHGPDFARRHAAAAGANSTFCANCHEERECADCHDGRVRPRRLHPNDWLSLHGRASVLGSPRCTSCHRQQSFCVGCHQRLGVAETAPTRAAGSRGRFHPPPSLWTDAPRTRQHHAWAAKRNLESCVSCHVERDCVACHATSARGGAGARSGQAAHPHGRGFASRCRAAYRRNPRPCWVCHHPDDPELAACK